MTDLTATVLNLILTLQECLLTINSNLLPTKYYYPDNSTLTNGTTYTNIVIGSGTGGATVASRLSFYGSVLLLENGGYPPLESQMPGAFTILPMSTYDYNMYSQNDNITSQYLVDNVTKLTLGKMLGGSSALNHMIHVQGDPHDFEVWAELLNDTSFTQENLLPYFKKLECLLDSEILADSTYAALHGTDGPINILRQQSSDIATYLNAINGTGSWRSVLDTTSLNSSLGFTEPLLHIYNGIRQSVALQYLNSVKDSSNLTLALSATATKILINGTTAYGVQVLGPDGQTYVLYASNAVVTAAGAIGTPKLLMHSGIGPKEHLESLDITCLADLPVGENLMDHPGIWMLYTLDQDESAATSMNYNAFPVPMMVGYDALNTNQTYPDYQGIFLKFSPNNTAMLQLCAQVFKYKNDLCNSWYNQSLGKTVLLVIHNLMKPKSRGKVLLSSANFSDDPLVYLRYLNNTEDLTLMVETMKHFNSTLLSTEFFQDASATFINPTEFDLADNAFLTNYAQAMTGTMWHLSGSCAMGNVTTTKHKVKGFDNLYAADACLFPDMVSGNVEASVNMLAERAADCIINDS